ncbi:hypothetical protein [Alteribacter natronophilus]|uniref:hypothetical protein n=1 Tax=Alteribacter natronophilus TaxID=2583810 RepID=UPI00110E68F4|nr:hypothetical protein [Alteribacter natronophilus]TMW71028.1 hypothetical protein FGB90_13730 [Alteribacter natronophilus]
MDLFIYFAVIPAVSIGAGVLAFYFAYREWWMAPLVTGVLYIGIYAVAVQSFAQSLANPFLIPVSALAALIVWFFNPSEEIKEEKEDEMMAFSKKWRKSEGDNS